MPSCPSGHHSTAIDFCDVCGRRLRAPSDTPPTPAWHGPAGPPRPPPPGSAQRGGPCPECRTPRIGRFCEECGYDFSARATEPPANEGGRGGARWRAIVGADPAYYQYMVDQGMLDPERIVFPVGLRRRGVPLEGERVRVGRGNRARGLVPEIDLGGAGGDPAVSQIHAVLLARPGGTWALIDPGSTNGTTINGTADPIGRDVAVPLNDGDRIYLGAWTVIILQKGWSR
ncbi:FHA domain-containing protein [Nocardiopsis alba]|uniref:FHA domain-containing protein n=1 Tax=Nocardiopsis alba TaxID=53437 RepID=UPI0033A64F1B